MSKGANTGNSSWGGMNNAMSYIGAATKISNTVNNWGDEDYNRESLGDNAGLMGSM